jgi:hypothetical protein
MLSNVIDSVRDVPAFVRASQDRLIEDLTKRQEQLVETRQSYSRWLRRRVFEARESGETQLWELHVGTLERAHDLLDNASVPPAMERVETSARDLLGALEHATTHPPLEDYDNLNVRKVMSDLRELDRFGLLRVRRYEGAHKNRKTILDSVHRELTRRSRLAGAV